jgi:hypothetical protein
MSRFELGLMCGFVSAFLTWCCTGDVTLACIVGGIVAVLVWLFGGIVLAVFGD